MNFFSAFPRGYIVNLEERKDRRSEIEKEFINLGIALEDTNINFFKAVRPDNAAGFPNIGARGCFLSHLNILRDALNDNLSRILIMEDDLAISQKLIEYQDELISALDNSDWDIIYFGHFLNFPDESQHLTPYTDGVRSTHFYAVNGKTIPLLVEFLETVLGREPGDPAGGPMHVDGAISTFRAQNPTIKTLLVNPSVGGQRSSKSDISPGILDKLPIINTIVKVLRKLK